MKHVSVRGPRGILIQIDFQVRPKEEMGQSAIQFPQVDIYSRAGKEFSFQGLWGQPKVEKKVDEILRGLKRVAKDWRPVVPGMTPAIN